jgi:hypothetical protein
VLFLRFVADRRERSVSQLDLGDFDPPEVLAFLEHLETTRHNLVATRNVRLAAIHAFSDTAPPGIPRGSSIANVFLPFPSSARVPAPFTTWNTMRFRRCSVASIEPRPMDVAITCCSLSCSILAPESRKSSHSASGTCSWKRFRKFVFSAKVARSAGVLCGRKPRNCCGTGSGNQSHPIARSSVIIAVTASRGSVCVTSSENTAHAPKSRHRRWVENGCTRTACATVPLSISFAQA